MSSLSDFLSRRKAGGNEFFASPGGRRTVLVCGHGGTSDEIAYALVKLGYNVFVSEPWNFFWDDDRRLVGLDNHFRRWAQAVRKNKVQLILGTNSLAMVPHPRTRELLHRYAGVPVVNWWWEEPRTEPAMARRGLSAYDYLNAVRDERVLNVFSDIDVSDEMRQFLAVENGAHVPLGVSPELWENEPTPLRQRPVKVCFIDRGIPAAADVPPVGDPVVLKWATQVADLKLANPDRPMVECIESIGGPGEQRGNSQRRPYELAANLTDEFERWRTLNEVLRQQGRDFFLAAAREQLGTEINVVHNGLTANGVTKISPSVAQTVSKKCHVSARATLELHEPWLHGGVSSSTYEIAATGGLIVARHQRELPALFSPANECLTFRTPTEMQEALDRISREPDDFDALVAAGRRRVAEHTWEQRLLQIVELAKARFDLPW